MIKMRNNYFKIPTALILCCALFLLGACNTRSNKEKEPIKDSIAESEESAAAQPYKVKVRYAKGFKVNDFGTYRLIDIQDPVNENASTYHYALVPRGTAPKGIPENYTVIETPVERVVCMTALQMSNFIKLGQTDKIVGINSTRFLFNEKIKQQLAEKRTSRIGIEGNFDNEVILSINPDIILVSPFKKGGYDAIRNLGFPLVTFLGYKEISPLGQAEWIKFTAMLLGVEDEANMLFDKIEKRYNDLRDLAAKASPRPKVMSGELHGGNWYVVGGESYLAHLFEDAGADYFMQNDNESGGYYVDFERVYAEGANADFWRIINSFEGEYSYQALKQTDSRYADFKAFKERQVIYCSLRYKPFYENTPVEPEVVLADLIKAFHPELLPDYTPVYYELLK